MESVIWAFKQLHDKGLAYEGYRVLPYCWRDETPLSNHELRMDDDVYKMRQDQTVTVTFPLRAEGRSRSASPAVRALAWTTTPWTLPDQPALAVGPDIEYAVRAGRTGRDAGRRTSTCSPRTCSATTRRTSATTTPLPPRRRHRHLRGHRARRPALRPLLDYYADAETWGTEQRLADPGRRLRHHRRRHRHRPPGAGLRRGRPAGLRGRRHPGDHVRRRRARTFLPISEVPGLDRRHAGVRGEQAAHPRCCKAEGRLLRAGELRALLPALLALPQPADLQGRVELVRAGHRVPRPHGRAQPADQLGARRTSRTASSASGSRTPATGRSAATGTGARPSRCGRATTRTTRASTSTARSPSSRRDFGRCRATRRRGGPAPPVHRRAHPPEPRRPDRPVDDAPHRGRARRLVRLRLDAVRPGALPVREPGLVRQPQPGATSSSSTSARPAAGSTPCTCCPPRCSTARRSRNVISHGIVLGSDGQKMSKSPAQLPGRVTRCSTATAPTRCAGS